MAPEVPPLFKCPISLELMKDPVTLCTGQTYDRCSIAPWLENGHTTCPATMLQLESLHVVPNHTLRRLIQEWYRRNRPSVEALPLVKMQVDPASLATLMQEIALGPEVLAPLKTLRGVTRDNARAVRDAGGVSVISAVLASQESSCEDSSEEACIEVSEEALAVLVALVPVCDHQEFKLGLIGGGAVVVSAITNVLSKGSLDSRANAAIIVTILAHTSPELHFRDAKSVFVSLEKLLREDLYPRAIKASLRAFLALCKAHRRNHILAVEANVVPALIELLPELQKSNAERALGILDLVCTMAEGRAAVMDHDLAMAVFVSLFHTISAPATEYIVSILWSLCQVSQGSLAAAEQAGLFAPLLLLLQMECAPKTRHKCGELLKQVKRPEWKEISCDNEFFYPFISTV